MLYKLPITIIFISFLFSSEILNKAEIVINESIPNNKSISHKLIKLDFDISDAQNLVKQKFFRKELHVWKIQENDSTFYYGVLDNVIGKTMPITFLTIFDKDHRVNTVEIIKYREDPYGSEVKNKNWCNQFKGYSDTSDYNIGRGIDGISGATLSVHSVTKGINKLSLIIRDIISKFNHE